MNRKTFIAIARFSEGFAIAHTFQNSCKRCENGLEWQRVIPGVLPKDRYKGLVVI